MLKPKIHFARVPLSVAKKVLADELRRKNAAERAQLSRKKELEEAPLEKPVVSE
jgi:hypothetical protein